MINKYRSWRCDLKEHCISNRSVRMNMSKYLGDLFEHEPIQWGLRGDSYLWREMKSRFVSTPLPASWAKLEDQIAEAFLILTGKPITTPKMFKVDRFAHRGTSRGSGLISPDFWRDGALVLLKKRYEEA